MESLRAICHFCLEQEARYRALAPSWCLVGHCSYAKTGMRLVQAAPDSYQKGHLGSPHGSLSLGLEECCSHQQSQHRSGYTRCRRLFISARPSARTDSGMDKHRRTVSEGPDAAAEDVHQVGTCTCKSDGSLCLLQKTQIQSTCSSPTTIVIFKNASYSIKGKSISPQPCMP